MINLDRRNELGGVPRRRLPEGILAGGILIAIGSLVLVAQFTTGEFIGPLILLGMAAIFLIAGVVGRSFGLLTAGAIFLGVTAGVAVATTDVVRQNLSEQQMGAVVILCIALGFLAIVLLAALVLRVFAWWPFIPAGVLTIVGLGLLGGPTGLRVLEVFGYLWPVILILLGAYLLIARGRTGGTHRL